VSPTDNDLRAALRDGEGDGVDADRVIIRADRARAKRRSQLLNAAAVTVLVSGLGVGGAYLLGGNDGQQKNSSSGAGGAAGSASSQENRRADVAAGDSAYGQASAKAAAASVPCPGSLPAYTLPITGAGGALFSAPVSTVVVCSYGSTDAARGASPAAPARLVLNGKDATDLADSLEHASTTKPTGMCPNYRSADERALAIIGMTADGTRAGLVTTTLNRPACAVVVSNGKSVRYAWNPPVRLVQRLNGLTPGNGAAGPSGSPTK
jgi:hypothetical protein